MEKERFSSKVVVRLRPLSSSEEAKAAAGAASSRCAQPTPCGKALVLSGVGSATSSSTNSAAAPPTTPATAAADNNADNSASSSSFSFPDGVLGEGATQRQVYETVAEVVEGVLQGKSASIVAYGQTGAGKTHTLFGSSSSSSSSGGKRGAGTAGASSGGEGDDDNNDDENAGIAPRALSALCRALVAAGGAPAGASLTLSAVEIYCDKVRCLLTKGGGGAGAGSKASVTVGAGSAADGGGVALQGAACCPVDLSRAPESVAALLAAAARARVVASTGMNDASSRSHAVIIATVRAPMTTPRSSSSSSSSAAATAAAAAATAATKTTAKAFTRAKLALVDLAGSERASRAQATGSVAAEGRAINASLTALGKVVAALAEEGGGGAGGEGRVAAGSPLPSSSSSSSSSSALSRVGHVPYRDSSLTRVLRDCLDGSSRVAFLVCASPAAADARETLGSLRFGARARGLVAAVQVGAVSSSIPAPRTPAEEEETRRKAQARKAAAKKTKTIGGETPPGRRGGGGGKDEEEGEEEGELWERQQQAAAALSSSSPPRLFFSSLSRLQRGAIAALLSAVQLAAVFVLVQGK